MVIQAIAVGLRFAKYENVKHKIYSCFTIKNNYGLHHLLFLIFKIFCKAIKIFLEKQYRQKKFS